MGRLNPHCRIEAIHTAIADENAEALLGDCNVIFDATDNRATRQILNRVSVGRRVPFVFGGINGWEGMAATYIPDRSTCFSCLFPHKSLTQLIY